MLLVSELNKITIKFIERVNAFESLFLLFQATPQTMAFIHSFKIRLTLVVVVLL